MSNETTNQDNIPKCLECPFVKPPMVMSLMVLYAILLHTIWGINILIEPSSSMITATSFLKEMVHSTVIVGLLYLIVSISASFTLFGKPKKWKMFLALPQQALLIQSAMGAIRCMINGHFADGVARPIPFIIADQSPIIIAMLLHTIALIRMGSRIFSISYLKRVNDIINYDNS